MSPQRLITQCPYCDTRFRITPEQLDAAGGKARCSRCQKVFNAGTYLLHQSELRRAPVEPRRSSDQRSVSAPSEAPPLAREPKIESVRDTHAAAVASTNQLDLNLDAETQTSEIKREFEFTFDFENTAPSEIVGEPVAAGEETPSALDDNESPERVTEYEPDTSAAFVSADAGWADDKQATESDSTGMIPADSTETAGLDSDESEDSWDTLSFDAIPDDTETADDQLENNAAPEAEDATTPIASKEESEPLDATTDAAASLPAVEAVEENDLHDFIIAEPPPEEHSKELAINRASHDERDSEWLSIGLGDSDHPRSEDSYEISLGAPPDAATGVLFADWGHQEPYEEAASQENDAVADVEPLPEAPPAQEPEAYAEALFDEPAPAGIPEDTGPPEPKPEVVTAAPVFSSALVDELEETLLQRKSRLPSLAFGLGSLLLVALLLYQAGHIFRTDLYSYPALAPIASWFCTGADCEPPAQSAPDRIRIVNRDVRPHPREAGALLLSLSFVNEAEFAQKFPILEVRFSDTHDQLIALRRFQPSEYLSGDRRSSDPLPPGELVAIGLSVVDPGENAVSFRFEFF